MTRRSPLAFRLVCLYILSISLRAVAVPRNYTIDDEFGDERTRLQAFTPRYTPSNGWKRGAECTDCSAKLDISQVFGGTWHDTTHRPGDDPHQIAVTFEGSAVYAFFVLANLRPNGNTFPHTVLSINIDGGLVGRFEYEPRNTSDFTYSAPVYSNSSVPPGRHELLIQASGQDTIIMLFDRVVYTFDDAVNSTATSVAEATSTPPGSASSDSGAVVGGVVGGIVGGLAFIIVVVGVLFFRRRRRHSRSGFIRNASPEDPFIDEDVRMSRLIPTPYPSTQPSNSEVSTPDGGYDPYGGIPAGALLPPGSVASLSLNSHRGASTTSVSKGPLLVRNGDIDTSQQLSQTGARSKLAIVQDGDKKTPMTRQEIQKQMEEVQKTIAMLRSQATLHASADIGDEQTDGHTTAHRTSASPTSGLLFTNLPQVGRATGVANDTESLWRQIAELQAEVELLRTLQEPPPGYAASLNSDFR